MIPGAAKFKCWTLNNSSHQHDHLEYLFPRLATGVKLINSPLVIFNTVTDDDAEDYEDLEEGIQSLQTELAEVLLRIHPPPATIPATPTSQYPVTSIDLNDDTLSSLCPNLVASASRKKCNVGKVLMLTMGYSKKDGPKLLQMRESITDIFEMSVKKWRKHLETSSCCKVWSRPTHYITSIDRCWSWIGSQRRKFLQFRYFCRTTNTHFTPTHNTPLLYQ